MFGGSKVGGRQASGEPTVHFFRPRAIDIVGTESGFDMCHGYLPVESGESGHGGCCGVAMDKHEVGLHGGEYLAHSCEDGE